jgi:hypothetical protein
VGTEVLLSKAGLLPDHQEPLFVALRTQLRSAEAICDRLLRHAARQGVRQRPDAWEATPGAGGRG